jgi:type I restriction enzyme S subunit
LFTGSSEIADEAGMSSAVTTEFEDEVYLNSFSFGVRFNENIKLIPEFSKYLFRSQFMRTEIAKTASGVTRFNISKPRLGSRNSKSPFHALKILRSR